MKVRIGHLDYNVELMSPQKADAEKADGLFYARDQKICVRADLPPAQAAGVLIHELIHAMFHAYGLPHNRLTEEDVATKLEGPLASLIRDNPTLIANIAKGLAGKRMLVK